jgi:hypothetical protein
VRLEGFGQLKNPMTSSGIEPEIFWLNQLRYRVPLKHTTWGTKFPPSFSGVCNGALRTVKAFGAVLPRRNEMRIFACIFTTECVASMVLEKWGLFRFLYSADLAQI